MRLLLSLLTTLLFSSLLFAQTATIEGYVFESGNRGYLNLANIDIISKDGTTLIANTVTNKEGVFKVEVPLNGDFDVRVSKDLFDPLTQGISTIGTSAGQKLFMKFEMNRVPGYIFDVTIAAKKQDDKITDAITGARIEVYNNTTEKEELVIENHPGYTFKTHFEQGNHYTIMIRKDKFFNKRMDAFVNVEGCILCFEGVGEVKPSDVLTEGHAMGTLLANVELTPIEINKGIKLENVYYDSGKASVRKEGLDALDQLIIILKNNPSMLVEIGSHTDSNGKDSFNQKLSERRAKTVVDYLVNRGEIGRLRLISKGYGESKLVNGCGNGVECSERKHQQNRRTEFKVVGYVDDPFENKSLAEIIEEEKFLEMLKEVENQEQVKVAAGEELPDEIKAKLTVDSTSMDQPSVELPDAEATKMETEVEENEAPKESTKEVKKPSKSKASNIPSEYNQVPQPDKSQPRVTTDFQVNSQESNKVTSAPKISEDLASEFVKDKIELEESKEVKKELVSEQSFNLDPRDIPTEYNESSSEGFGETEADQDATANQIFGEFPINVKIVAKAPKYLPKNYTGYRVEFFNSSYQLPLSHEIFSRHGNITLEQKNDGSYAYLLGDFDHWRDANKFLSTILAVRYDDANVIRYKKGRRILE